MRIRTMSISLLALVSVRCGEPGELYDDYVDHLQTTGTASESPADDEGTASDERTTGVTSVATVTTNVTSSGTSGEATGEDEPVGSPPEIFGLAVDPEAPKEAGPVLVTLDHSANASHVSLVARGRSPASW